MFDFLFQKKNPFNSGYLPELDGHEVYFQEFGNPEGSPVLMFHGGPGSCSKWKYANLINLKKYRVIQFDQRGCGKSLPAYETKNNTLQDIIEDAHKLLQLLSLDKVTIYGGSWGATLGLVFAQTYPKMIDKLICSQTFLARKEDIEWCSIETELFYPDIMCEILSEVPPSSDIRKHYAKMIRSKNKADQIKATRLYGGYEHIIGELNPVLSDEEPIAEHINGFKLYMHYDMNDYFLKENQILSNINVYVLDFPLKR